MDWFERLTGFPETSYAETRAKLAVAADRLISSVNGKSYRIGKLEVLPLETLRNRSGSDAWPGGRLRVKIVQGDVREMHRSRQYESALFQVASQFNLLEMVGPAITPEDGVT